MSSDRVGDCLTYEVVFEIAYGNSLSAFLFINKEFGMRNLKFAYFTKNY